jgi:hypothetical protein
MSYFTYEVTCPKCGKKEIHSGGIVGSTPVGASRKNCDCGGEFYFKQKERAEQEKSP